MLPFPSQLPTPESMTPLDTPENTPHTDPQGHRARIVEIQRNRVQVHDGQHTRSARVSHALQRELADAADALAVGDWVLLDADDGVQQRLPPRNQLSRRLNDGRDKNERLVIVSNVDTAFLVMGLDADFNLRRLDRYIALVRMAGVQPVVVLTKADRVPDAGRKTAEARAALPADVPCVSLNALDGERCRVLLSPWLPAGHTAVLLGSSGAGKSTLTNALCAQAAQITGPAREGDGRGRHTTTVRTLLPCVGGASIIDTPGLRSLRLDGDEKGLAQAYADVAQLASGCRFRNCQHAGEPGCAVANTLDPDRLNSWHKLQREAQRDTMTALERQRQLSEWKQRSRAGRQRLKDKRQAP
jgi:ribosome biogenesis GTPase / thiamine phosphate phosphatase